MEIKEMLNKIMKHARQGTLLSVVSRIVLKKLGLYPQEKANPDKYYGEKAQSYHEQRLKTDEWHTEQSIMQELLLEVPDGSTVLDVPFGTGRFVDMYLQKRMTVFGLDISKDMLAVAQESLGKAFTQSNVCIGRADCLPYEDESFDSVVSCRFFYLLTFDMAKNVLSELQRVSKSIIYLTINIRKEGLSYTNIVEPLVAPPKRFRKLGGNIYEKDLVSMFNEFGLDVRQKKIIRGETHNKIYLFYVLEKSAQTFQL